jgi:hypothetical protein
MSSRRGDASMKRQFARGKKKQHFPRRFRTEPSGLPKCDVIHDGDVR